MAGCCNVEDVVEFICSKLEGKPICEDVRNHLLSISPTDFKENQTATEGLVNFYLNFRTMPDVAQES